MAAVSRKKSPALKSPVSESSSTRDGAERAMTFSPSVATSALCSERIISHVCVGPMSVQKCKLQVAN